jgi:transposase
LGKSRDTHHAPVHIAGEKLFVDYSGRRRYYRRGASSADFVAVMGASNCIYVDATFTQKLPDWIASHVCAFNYFGGS